MPVLRLIQFFVSYNSKDRRITLDLHRLLEDAGVACWIDVERINPGDVLLEKLQQGVKSSDAMLVIWGRHGIGLWQKDEVQAAIAESKTRRFRIIAVILEDTEGTEGLPFSVNQRLWLDLRPSQRYGISRQKLVEDLKKVRIKIHRLKVADRMASKKEELGFLHSGLEPYLERLAREANTGIQPWKVQCSHKSENQKCEDCEFKQNRNWVELAYEVGLNREEVKVHAMISVLHCFQRSIGFARSEYKWQPDFQDYDEAHLMLERLLRNPDDRVDSILIPRLELVDDVFTHLELKA